MAKTLEEIKDDYAKSLKYECFLTYILEGGGITESDINNIAKLYANQKLEEAAEKTNLEFGLRKNSAFATIVKQSILNLREEV